MTSKNNIQIVIVATDNASIVFRKTRESLSELSDSTTSLWKVWNENRWKITAAAWAVFAWISYYIKQWIDDVNEYNYSIKRLEKLTKNSTWATDEQVKKLIEQAESLEKVWVATKENIVASMSQFATFDMSTEAISKLTNAFVDYVVAEKWATASSQEYRSMANGLAQALNGNYASLSRTWFILDEETKSLIKNWSEMEKVNAIVKVLNTTYRDFNQTAWETAEGKLILLQRSLNDIRETIAATLLPIIEKVGVIWGIVNSLSERVDEHPKLATAIVWVTAALAWLIGIIWAVSLALPAITAAIALLSWPIGIVIWALTALWVAYTTNFWWFRDFVNEIWVEISPVIEEIAAAFSECFKEIWETIKEVYKQLEPILIPFWEVFKEAIKVCMILVSEIIVSSFKTIWDVISWWLNVFSEFLDFIQNVFQWNWEEAFNNLVNIVSIWWETIISIFQNFWIDLPQIFESLKSVLTWIWDSLFSWLKDICKWAVDWISDKISAIWDKIAAAKDAISNLWSSSSAPIWWRASWWRVIAWETYRVNEIYWEYFTPASNGTISVSPLNWSPNVTINFGNVILNNWDDESSFAEKVRGVMMDVYRNRALGCY